MPFRVVMTGQIYNFGRTNLQKRTNRKKVRTYFQNLPRRPIRTRWNRDFFRNFEAEISKHELPRIEHEGRRARERQRERSGNYSLMIIIWAINGNYMLKENK